MRSRKHRILCLIVLVLGAIAAAPDDSFVVDWRNFPILLDSGTSKYFIDVDKDKVLDATEPNLTINAPLGTTGDQTIAGDLTVTGGSDSIGVVKANQLYVGLGAAGTGDDAVLRIGCDEGIVAGGCEIVTLDFKSVANTVKMDNSGTGVDTFSFGTLKVLAPVFRSTTVSTFWPTNGVFQLANAQRLCWGHDPVGGETCFRVDANETMIVENALGGLSLPIVSGGSSLPTVTVAGAVVIKTNDATVGACTGNSGSAVSLCRWTGSVWASLGDGHAAKRTQFWNADSWSTDGTQCPPPTQTLSMSGFRHWGVACTFPTAETDGWIYGSWVLPDSINVAVPVEFKAVSRIATDNGGSTLHGLLEVQCLPPSAQFSATWISQQQFDVVQAAGDNINDFLNTTATVDLTAGTPDCAPGDSFFWRWLICDVDATPTAGCTSQTAGTEDDFYQVMMQMEYTTTNVGD